MILTKHITRGLLIIFFLFFMLDFSWSNNLQKPISKNKIKVFLLAGQSNMEGRADANKLLNQDLERISMARKNVYLAYNNELIAPLGAVEPSPDIAEIYKRDLIFGPELFFGVELSEAMPDEKILLIKLAEGGTSLHGCWNPKWNKDKAAIMEEENESKLYSSFINYVNQTLSEYGNDEYEICAMLWVQGETDSGNKAASAAYGDNLQKLIKHVRNDVGINKLPFLLFQVGNEKVVEGMENTAQKLPNVFLIPQSLEPASADFYEKMENGHYNYVGMKKLGQRFAQVYLNLISK